jgi:peptidoglycan hydrolase FlgJ
MLRACETVCACKRRRTLQGRRGGVATYVIEEQQRRAARKMCNRVGSVLTQLVNVIKAKMLAHAIPLIEAISGQSPFLGLMTIKSYSTSDVATDLQGLAKLRASAQANPRDPATIRAVAGQFEALFTQMVLKSMREASLGDPSLGEQGAMYRDLFDLQLAMNLSAGRGLGLADALARQLGGAVSKAASGDATGEAAPTGTNFPPPILNPMKEPTSMAPTSSESDTANAFVNDVWPAAEKAAHALGVAPEALVAQAALESGWGKNVIRNALGESSFNIFGIKADSSWRGARVSAPTLEYDGGVPVRRQGNFRAYDSIASAFEDYVDFLKSNPRYQSALRQGIDAERFVQGLQEAGYATDPTYAAKVSAIMDGPRLTAVVAALKNPSGR